MHLELAHVRRLPLRLSVPPQRSDPARRLLAGLRSREDRRRGVISGRHGWTPLIAGDTAGAAREIVEAHDVTQASISPPLAAEIYGLEVLARDIEDEEHNTTRFVLLSPELVAGARRATVRW